MFDVTTNNNFRRDALIDLLAAFAIFGVSFFLASWLDAFEAFEEFSRTHEDWNLDEIFTGLVILTVVTAGMSIRRLAQSH